MQILKTDYGARVHCSLYLVVKLLHPNYTDEQIKFISPYIKRVLETSKLYTSLSCRRIGIPDVHIASDGKGWYSIKGSYTNVFQILATHLENYYNHAI